MQGRRSGGAREQLESSGSSRAGAKAGREREYARVKPGAQLERGSNILSLFHPISAPMQAGQEQGRIRARAGQEQCRSKAGAIAQL